MDALQEILQQAPRLQQFCDVVGPVLPTVDEIADDLAETLATGQITNDGRFVRQLEAAFAEMTGVSHAIAVANGTLALCLSLRALPQTGEVICPSFTFCATAHSIVWAGCEPVFCDIDQATWVCTAETIAPHLTDCTVAIMPTHIFGVPCPVDQIQHLADSYGLPVIYDSAQAAGSRYQGAPLGRFGRAESFSLHATKVLPAGEGGIVTTHDDYLAQWLRRARNFGLEDGDCAFVGINAKLAEYPAIIGLHSLRILPRVIQQRRLLMEEFRRHLAGLDGITLQTIPDYATTNCQNLVIRITANRFGLSRNQVASCLGALNIDSRLYFDPPLHQMTCYTRRAAAALPVAERLCAEALCLPLHGRLETADMRTIAAALRWLADRADELAPILPDTHS